MAWSPAQTWPRATAESGSVARDTFLEAPVPQEDEERRHLDWLPNELYDSYS